MTRRQRRDRKQRNPRIWFPDDIAQLLSWLDHCIETGDDFESTVQERLRATVEKTYTWDQIATKLRKLWAAFSGERLFTATSSELFCQGTTCLPLLDEDLAGRIKHIRSTLASGTAGKKPYRLRSTSNRQSEARNDAVECSSQATSPLSALGPTPRSITPSSNARTSTSDSVQPKPSNNPDETDAASDHSYVPDKFMTSTLVAPESNNATMDLLRKQVENNEKNISLLHKDLKSKDNHILRLKIELNSAKEELKEIKECLKMRVGSDPTAQVVQLQYSESYLKQQLAHTQSLHANIRSDTERNSTNQLKTNMTKSLYTLEREVLDICTNLQDWLHNEPISTQALSDHAETLEPLVRRVFASGMLGLKEAFSTDRDTQLSILRVLVIASVFIDVFEATVFDFLSHESALLAKYRECLLLKDGARQLEIIDWLAHHSLMSDSTFRVEILETKATDLASCLLRNLMTLWSFEFAGKPLGYERLLQSLNGDGEDGVLFHPILKQFQDIFIHALRIKVDLLLTGHTFLAEFAEIGTLIVADSMIKDGYAFDYNTPIHKEKKNAIRGNHTATDSETETVKLCFFPAIYKLPPAEQDTDAILACVIPLPILNPVNELGDDFTNQSFDMAVVIYNIR
ncbi:hypothetical protein JX266_009064 [Neoarthrinium moseri]|nr:hypothetical protein JX266_009064 [Neoarthrinium moseri]